MNNNKPCDTIGCAAEVPEGVKNCDRHLCYALKEPTSASAVQAVAEYLTSIKGNLRPKETCPHCGGSNAPYDQVDCVDTPCPIGRDYRRPPLEEVIQHIETLLGVAAPVGAGNH